MANAEAIIDVVGQLDIPRGEYVVFGGATLALLGIREARDVELFVSKSANQRLITRGWPEKTFSGRNRHLLGVIGCLEVEVFCEWDSDGWQPAIKSYLQDPQIIQGVPCMPLNELMIWKRLNARPKDLRDLELVHEWRQSSH